MSNITKGVAEGKGSLDPANPKCTEKKEHGYSPPKAASDWVGGNKGAQHIGEAWGEKS